MVYYEKLWKTMENYGLLENKQKKPTTIYAIGC